MRGAITRTRTAHVFQRLAVSTKALRLVHIDLAIHDGPARSQRVRTIAAWFPGLSTRLNAPAPAGDIASPPGIA